MSKRVRKIERFEVTGRGSFPIDMLRYDACFPERGADAAEIERSFRERGPGLHRITLKGDGTMPEVARWQSFGWSVLIDGEEQGVPR